MTEKRMAPVHLGEILQKLFWLLWIGIVFYRRDSDVHGNQSMTANN